MKQFFNLRITIAISLVMAAFSFAFDDVVWAPNIAPQAMLAKQVAPGTTRSYSLSFLYGTCDTCEVLKENEDKDMELSGFDFRFDVSLLGLIWPRTDNTKGSENWTGNGFGGGIFLNAHYTPLTELGISPMVVQWLGPVYVGAAYELSWGFYVGEDEDGYSDYSVSSKLFTGSLNVGGGSMVFMNNHGLGFGLHGGVRQMHVVSAGKSIYTGKNNGRGENPESRGEIHAQDWVCYYGFDFMRYSNIPLLGKVNHHGAFLASVEMGLNKSSMFYWSLSLSLIR